MATTDSPQPPRQTLTMGSNTLIVGPDGIRIIGEPIVLPSTKPHPIKRLVQYLRRHANGAALSFFQTFR